MKKIIFCLIFILVASYSYAAEFHTRATGAVALATTVTSEGSWQLKQFSIKLSAAGGAGDLTVTVDANAGAAYDINLYTQDMTAVTNLVVTYNPPIVLNPGDELDFAWANANTRTYGLDVVFERIN